MRKLKRKYADSALDAVLENMKKRQKYLLSELDNAKGLKPSEQLKLETHVHLVRGYDLRQSAATKALDTHALAGWTAFINVAHTLCHLVPKEGDLLVRIPLYYSLKGASDIYLRRMLQEKATWRFNV